jgi:hypothetical protein
VNDQELQQLHREIEATLQNVAYKLGRDEFGLKENEFVLRYMSKKKVGKGWAVARGGIIRIYFSMSPFDDQCADYLRRALQAVAKIRKSRRTDIVLYEGLSIPAHLIPSAYRRMYELPPLLDRNEVDVRIEYLVTITHPQTGVTQQEKGPVTKGFSRLIDKGRQNLTEKVIEVVRKLQDVGSLPEEVK